MSDVPRLPRLPESPVPAATPTEPVGPPAATVETPTLPGIGGAFVSAAAVPATVGADALVPPPPATGTADVAPPPSRPGVPMSDRMPPDPRGLYSISWLRTIFLALNVISLPLVFFDVLLALAASVAAYAVVIIWSALAVANVSRAKPPLALRHQSPPGVASMVLKWLAPAVMIVLGVVALGAATVWVDDAPEADQGGRAIALVCAVIVFLVAFVIATYLPYGHLARATSWVGGDGGKMRRWFWGPIVAALIGATIRFFLFISIAVDDSGTRTTVSLAIIGATAGLPWVVWLIFGNRAMIELESACEMTYQRALNPHGAVDASQVNPVVAGQAAMPAAAVMAPPTVGSSAPPFTPPAGPPPPPSPAGPPPPPPPSS